jgi:MFS family permease
MRDEAERAGRARRGKVGPLAGVYYGWIVLAAGSLVFYCAYGVQFSFGLFLPDIEAALAPGQRSLLTLGFGLYFSLMAAVSLFSGMATDRWGPRPVVLLGAVLLGGGLFWVSQARHLWEFFLGYGVVAALGMSSTWVPILTTAAKWFVARRGLALGIVASAIGLGQLTVPFLSGLFLAPHVDWRTAYVVYSVLILVTFALASLLLEKDPESLGLAPDASPARAAAGADPYAGETYFTVGEAVRTSALWLVTLTLALFWSVVFLPSVHLPPFVEEELGRSTQAASLTITVVGLGSIVARLLGGVLADAIGPRPSTLLSIACQVLAFAAMWLSALLRDLPLAYVGAFLSGMGYGGLATLWAVVLADLFGRRFASSIGGVVFAVAASFSGLGIYLGGLLYDISGGYEGAFALAALISLVSAAPFLAVRRPSKPAPRAAAGDGRPQPGAGRV